MKVLVTGATGSIGRPLVKRLAQTGADVTCLVRNKTAADGLEGPGVRLIEADVTDIQTLYQAVAGQDRVYHLAAAHRAPDIKTIYTVNTLGTENVIEACCAEDHSLKRFVYISSAAAAGPSPDARPLKETDPPRPVTHYGRSKLLAEKALLRFKDRLPVVILRPPTVVGPGNLFFDTILSFIRRGIKPLWQGCTSLCGLDDCLDGLLLAAERAEAIGQTYFICDGCVYPWEEIVDAIASCAVKRWVLGVRVPRPLLRGSVPLFVAAAALTRKPHLANKVIELTHQHWLCDPSKIGRDLGFRCRQDLRTAMDAWRAGLTTSS